jgi:hypothetical protein
MKGVRMLSFFVLPVSFLVFSFGLVAHLYAEKADDAVTAPIDSGPGGVLEAEVTAVEPNVLLVKKADGEVARVPMPGESGKSASDFSKGDKIEAVITPEGVTTSVRIVPSPTEESPIQ